MDKETAGLIAFVPAIVLFPLYVWFLARHKPVSKPEKIVIAAKEKGYIVTADLIKSKYKSSYYWYSDAQNRQIYVPPHYICTYAYSLNGKTYKQKWSVESTHPDPKITLYYDPKNAKHAYPEDYAKEKTDNGCLLKFLGFLPFLAPFIVAVALIKVFNINC